MIPGVNLTPTRLERTLAWFSPRIASKRMASRAQYEFMRSYYAAADQDRNTGGWRKVSGDDPNARLRADASLIADRARYLVESTSHGAASVQSIVDATVGAGISLQCKAQFTRSETETAKAYEHKQQQKVEDYHRRWAEYADFERRMCWEEMQQTGLRETVTAGEVMLREVADPSWTPGSYSPIPLQYQMIRRERLATFGANPTPGHEIIDGLEIDEWGRPVAYHILDDGYAARTQRVPYNEIIHPFRMDFPNQRRGLSWLACVIPEMQSFAEVKEYTLIAKRVQSAIALIVSQDPSGNGGGVMGLNKGTGDATDTNGSPQRFIEPGMIHNVGTGRVTSHIPTPSHDLDVLTTLMLRSIGIGQGISYEWVTGDYSRTNFAGGRLSMLQTRKRIRPIHAFWVRRAEKPAHMTRCKYMQAIADGYPRAIAGTDYQASFSKPQFDWGANPLQEVKAALLAASGGIDTLEGIVDSQGGNWADNLQQIAKEVNFAAALNPALTLHPALQGSNLEEEPADANPTEPQQ